MATKNRLGKGLGALISDKNYNTDNINKGQLREILVQQIERNPYQPRQEFDQDELKELAKSIKEKGLIQPVTVRQVKPELFQLVSGERRWRASRMIGLKKIPAIIRDYDDRQMMETALIENLQREDLNPLEEAQAYQKMIEEFAMTQEDVADTIGKSRSSVANMVRLLKLPAKVQVYVSRETLSMGHARALLALKEKKVQIEAAEYIIKNHLSVRETEKYINRVKNKPGKKDDNTKPMQKEGLSPEWKRAQDKIKEFMGTDVKIKSRKNKKIISIECNDYNDIKRLISSLE